MWKVINQYRPSSSNDNPSLSPNQLNYYFVNIAEKPDPVITNLLTRSDKDYE
jgi:hypothetical protein